RTEVHGAEAQLTHLEGGAAESANLHVRLLCRGSTPRSAPIRSLRCRLCLFRRRADALRLGGSSPSSPACAARAGGAVSSMRSRVASSSVTSGAPSRSRSCSFVFGPMIVHLHGGCP